MAEFFDSVTDDLAVVGKGYDEADFKQLRRLERNVAGKQKPSFVVGVARSISYKKCQNNRYKTHSGNQKPKSAEFFVVEAADEYHGDDAEEQSGKLSYKLTVALSVIVVGA